MEAAVFTIGDEVRRARKNAGLEQADVAKALGVSRPLVSKWERGISEPTISQWRKLAEVCDAEWLLLPRYVERLTPEQGISVPESRQLSLRLFTVSVRAERRRVDAGSQDVIWSPAPDAEDGPVARSPLRTRKSYFTSHGAVSETFARGLLTPAGSSSAAPGESSDGWSPLPKAS